MEGGTLSVPPLALLCASLGVCKVGHERLKPQQHIPEAALRRLEYSLRRQAWGICCCDLSRPAACQATLHKPERVPGVYFTLGANWASSK